MTNAGLGAAPSITLAAGSYQLTENIDITFTSYGLTGSAPKTTIVCGPYRIKVAAGTFTG